MLMLVLVLMLMLMLVLVMSSAGVAHGIWSQAQPRPVGLPRLRQPLHPAHRHEHRPRRHGYAELDRLGVQLVSRAWG